MSIDSQQQVERSIVGTTDPTARRARYNRTALRFVVVLLAALLLINALFPLLISQTDAEVLTPTGVNSERVDLTVPIDDRRVLVSTLDNRVMLLDAGQPQQTASFENLVGGLGVSPDGTQIYVGTSDGKVTILDAALQPQREVAVTGRVVGLEAASGGFYVAHGSGAFSDRYWVSYFSDGAESPAFSTRVEFTLTAMEVTGAGDVFYSTLNSRVGRLDSSGAELWKVTLAQPPTVIRFIPETAQVLIGDERGNLTLLTEEGATLWAIHLSEYAMRSVAAVDAGELFLAGDEHGDLYAVDAATTLRYSGRTSESPVRGLVHLGDDLTLIPRHGAWLTVNADAMQGAGQAATLRLVWYGINGVLLLALLAALVAAVERWRLATSRQIRFAWRQRTAYIFTLPAIGLILLFSYYPAATAFYYSLTNFNIRSPIEFIGLENYKRIILNDFYFRVGFTNLALILVANLLKTLTVPLLVAELIFRLRNSVHQYIFRTLFVLPAVVPGLISVFLWRMVYDPYAGLLNQILHAVGLSEWTRAWLGNEQTALWAIIGAGFPYISAFPFLIYMGGLLNISTEMYDAAKIDGAGWWRQFWSIDVPLLLSQMRLLLFFTLAGTIQGFAQIYIYTRGGPGYSTYVPGLQMYYQIAEGDFGYASAIGVILFVIIFLGTIFILRFRRQPVEMA